MGRSVAGGEVSCFIDAIFGHSLGPGVSTRAESRNVQANSKREKHERCEGLVAFLLALTFSIVTPLITGLAPLWLVFIESDLKSVFLPGRVVLNHAAEKRGLVEVSYTTIYRIETGKQV